VARYDVSRAWFRTPDGRQAVVYVREGTNDWNTANASMTEDEYKLRGLDLSGVALDLGGYLGTVAVGLLIDHPDLVVQCVEPIPENVELIWRNANANGVADRLAVHEAAIGDGRPVTINYAWSGDENGLHHAFVGNGNTTAGSGDQPHREVVVPTLTPSFFPAASLVKMDAEGGEWGFLSSGALVADLIVGEWHPVDGHTREDLVALLPRHVIKFDGPEGGPGEFRATRPDAGREPSAFPASQLGGSDV
jgi:FkbM family methyltransferase